jgi:hypothetical protein
MKLEAAQRGAEKGCEREIEWPVASKETVDG